MPQARESISVAVPTRARARLLGECLHSILRQTLPASEIVISEDGEDAETATVVRSYKTDGAPIRHVCNVPPLGQLGNRQRALQLTTGDFVAMLDDDDAWSETFLSETFAAIRARECDFCSTDHYIMDANSRVLDEESEAASKRFGRSAMVEGTYDDVLYRELVWKPFPLQFTLFSRAALASVGFFPPYAGVVPDFGLFLELGVARVSGFYLPRRLGRYRTHPEQQTVHRVETGEGLTACLRDFHARHHASLQPRERRELGKLYRQAVIELAIAYAHARQRPRAVNALRAFGSLGWGWPKATRVGVLTALLAGASKRQRGGEHQGLESLRA